jgi:pimeloyl-ACP methyl ester carboxylesterase
MRLSMARRATARSASGAETSKPEPIAMNVHVEPPRRERRTRVIALHCSGAGAGQWRSLGETLGGSFELLAPEHYGSKSAGPWNGRHAFTLADEAARAVGLIDSSEEQVHLVGHSYGGGVALHVALARPERIASLALYEPSAFHLLRQIGRSGAAAFAEITNVAQRLGEAVVVGDYRTGIAGFVDYWNGPGAWNALPPERQDALIRWAPKGTLDFHALFHEASPLYAYRALKLPVLVLRGEHAPAPTRVIAERLSEQLPDCRLTVVRGAGHMGPLTHAPEVSALIAAHVRTATPRASPASDQAVRLLDA